MLDTCGFAYYYIIGTKIRFTMPGQGFVGERPCQGLVEFVLG